MLSVTKNVAVFSYSIMLVIANSKLTDLAACHPLKRINYLS